MPIQRLSLSNRNLTPFNFSNSYFIHSSCPPVRNLSSSPFTVNCRYGFYNSVKRVRNSLAGLRTYGEMNKVRCQVLAKDGSNEDKDDSFYIRRCVELARKAIGCTCPNPMVGCVIVKDGKIVGEGFHPKAGQPHAEVFALRDAGDSAEGATAYVSLEPCNHYGRTPPCTEALIKAKIKKVVVGMVDPNPIVASSGLDKLRDAGIEVTFGVEEELCKRLNEAYIHQMLTRKPFVTLRYSLSVNGLLLSQLGEGASECGGYYSKLLQEYDAVIVSTSFIDTFSVPKSQEPGANQPLCIITATAHSSQIQIPSVAEETASKMIVFADKGTTVQLETAQKGIETVVSDQVSLIKILDYCKRQGLCSVLLDLRGSFSELEGLLNECIEHNMLQKVMVEVLPFWEQSGCKNSFEALNSVSRRLKVNNLQPRISNESTILEGYF